MATASCLLQAERQVCGPARHNSAAHHSSWLLTAARQRHQLPCQQLRCTCTRPRLQLCRPHQRPFRAGPMKAAQASTSTADPLPRTWSNPTGSVLTRISEHVWAAERPFVWFGIDVGGRSAVIRLADGSLWVNSPVELTPQLKEALDEVGAVKHIVSPNFEHTKFAQQWGDAYPDATLYACPGLMEKEPDKKYDVSIGENDEAPAEWLDEIELTYLSFERNPFTGKPFFNEVVFFHKPSRLLVATDLLWNYPSKDVPKGTRVWKFGMDQVYLPFYRNFMIKDKPAFQRKIARVTAWDFDAILPCHGSYIDSGGKQFLGAQLKL